MRTKISYGREKFPKLVHTDFVSDNGQAVTAARGRRGRRTRSPAEQSSLSGSTSSDPPHAGRIERAEYRFVFGIVSLSGGESGDSSIDVAVHHERAIEPHQLQRPAG